MKPKAGLWIDHQQAIVVFVTDEKDELKTISSAIENQHRQSDVTVPADDARQRELTQHLNHYYDKVISSLGKADAILIMGPGEAKGELKKRIERTTLKGPQIKVETVDKMTDPQIRAKVREYFLKPG